MTHMWTTRRDTFTQKSLVALRLHWRWCSFRTRLANIEHDSVPGQVKRKSIASIRSHPLLRCSLLARRNDDGDMQCDRRRCAMQCDACKIDRICERVHTSRLRRHDTTLLTHIIIAIQSSTLGCSCARALRACRKDLSNCGCRRVLSLLAYGDAATCCKRIYIS